MGTMDVMIWVVGTAIVLSLCYIIWGYLKGMKKCPRDLWFLFAAKVIEATAYGAVNYVYVIYLSKDCGLSDMAAGTYLGVWSMALTILLMAMGPVVDAVGIRSTLLLGTACMLICRVALGFTDSIYVVTALGFVPMALGTAIMAPVIKVGIKFMTSGAATSLGFGLFYVLMNLGIAFGSKVFDQVRLWMTTTNDAGELQEYNHIILPLLNVEVSTYQLVWLVGALLTLPSMFLVFLVRDGVEMNDDGETIINKRQKTSEFTGLKGMWDLVTSAVIDTVKIMKSVFTEKFFWIYLTMMGMLIPVRAIFYHFHYTWPKYGIRVLGDGFPIGTLFGVFNAILIVLTVPIITIAFSKWSSYRMMIIGTILSTGSVFIGMLPPEMFEPLVHTWVGELVYVRWLGLAPEAHNPLVLVLLLFFFVFTIGEAFWSPRLMQFSATVAPKGREGSYLALAFLPWFFAKIIVGPMTGWLVSTYTPEGAESYPNHHMIWLWIGGMALISPLCLVFFRKLFTDAETGKTKGRGEDDVDEEG